MFKKKALDKACPYCGGVVRKRFSVGDINQKISNTIFDYFGCSKCGLIYLDPIPKNIEEYYGQAYPAYQKIEDIKKQITDYDLQKIEILKKYSTGKNLLEIGPGNGTFSFLAKNADFNVDVIEMDINCCKFIEETVKIRKVINSNNVLESISKIEDKYDVVVMWHVLEHLKEPWDVLKVIPRILAENGVLILALPNSGSLQLKLFKQFWKHIDAPRHVTFFPIKLLEQELSSMGLKKILGSTNDPVSSIFNCSAWWTHSLNNYIQESKRGFTRKLLQNPRVAHYAYKYLIKKAECIEGYGNAYTVIFKK